MAGGVVATKPSTNVIPCPPAARPSPTCPVAGSQVLAVRIASTAAVCHTPDGERYCLVSGRWTCTATVSPTGRTVTVSHWPYTAARPLTVPSTRDTPSFTSTSLT